MEEFEYFLRLGSRLEKHNKMLMAYGAYLTAKQWGDDKSNDVIDSFLPILARSVSNSFYDRNQEIKEQLWEWIREGKIIGAFFCYKNILEHLNGPDLIDNDNAVLYHCLNIMMEEIRNGEDSSYMVCEDLNSLISRYYKLKFMVRRRLAGLCGEMEMEIERKMETEREFSEYVSAGGISKSALDYMTDNICIRASYPVMERPGYENNGNKEEIAFIIPVQDEELFGEAEYYIRHLEVPEGMSVRVIPIRGASSMTEAYNRGMNMTKARYKVYMHQDVMLLYSHMIYEICGIFRNPEIGMIGVAGVEKMPLSGVWWENAGEGDYRNLFQDSVMSRGHTLHNKFDEPYRRVEAIDGAFMATQYDVPWREDLFLGWHFYDISQCMEFGKRNYGIVVAGQPYGVWCLHEQKWNKTLGEDFYKAKECYLNNYVRNVRDL